MVSRGSTTASTVVVSRPTRRLTAAAPGRRVAHRRASGHWSARRGRHAPRSPRAWRTSRPTRSQRARTVDGRRVRAGWSTCQARVVRSSALACTSPPVASRAAATSPSAGDGSTTYSMPRPASRSTTSGVGRETSARTSGVKPASSAREVEDLVLAERDAVPAADRVGQPVVDVAADHQDPVGGAGHRALHHVRRDALVRRLVSRSWPPTTNQPRPTSGTAAATTTSTAPSPRRHERRGARGVLDDGLRAERGGHDEARPAGPPPESPSAAWVEVGGQVERDGADHRGGHRRDRGDDPADEHGHPGRARDQREHGEHGEDDAEPRGGPRSPTRPVTRSRASTIATGSRPPRAAWPRRRRAGGPGPTTGAAGRAPRPARRPAGPRRTGRAPPADDDAGRGRDDQAEQQGEEPQARRERADRARAAARSARRHATGGPPRGRRSRGRRGPARAAGPRRRRSRSDRRPGAADDRHQA